MKKISKEQELSELKFKNSKAACQNKDTYSLFKKYFKIMALNIEGIINKYDDETVNKCIRGFDFCMFYASPFNKVIITTTTNLGSNAYGMPVTEIKIIPKSKIASNLNKYIYGDMTLDEFIDQSVEHIIKKYKKEINDLYKKYVLTGDEFTDKFNLITNYKKMLELTKLNKYEGSDLDLELTRQSKCYNYIFGYERSNWCLKELNMKYYPGKISQLTDEIQEYFKNIDNVNIFNFKYNYALESVNLKNDTLYADLLFNKILVGKISYD